jgi:hypothetical protein
MPRKTVENELARLYADIAPMRQADLLAQRDDTLVRLQASTRSDMAGNPLNLTFVPQTYQQRVLRMWDAYGSDPLFKRLIDRTVDFCANGSQWEVPADSKGESWLKQLEKVPSARNDRLEREEDFWNEWSKQLNVGVPNVLPGLDQVVAWATRHVLLSGMFIPHWQLGLMTFGKQTYLVPKAITCYPASSITLRRENSLFMNENILYFKPVNYSTTMQEGQFIEAPTYLPRVGLPTNMVPIPPINVRSRDGDSEGWALKYQWSPGDVVGIRRGTVQTMGHGVYPLPPFFALLPQFAIRQKLFHADLAILDGLINYIMLYKIGDKDHPPKPPSRDPKGNEVPGTIATVRKLIQEGRVGPAMELFVPYYVELTIKQPDSSVLLSDTKYGSSATEIMAAFGIIYPRTASGARERFDKFNISGFEEFLGGIRQQIRAFLHMLSGHIKELNPTKLITTPRWSPNPLNTKSDSFMQELVKLKSTGSISLRTLLRYHSLDDDVELRRIAQELSLDVNELTNENVPLTFIQQTVDPGGDGGDGGDGGSIDGVPDVSPPSRKQTAIPSTRQTGRPPGVKGKPRSDKGTGRQPDGGERRRP